MGNAQLGKRGLHIGQRAKDHAGVDIPQVADAKRTSGQCSQATGAEDLIENKARALVLTSEAHLGCRHLMDRQPERVYAYASDNRRFVTDLDTEQDLRAVAARTGWRLELPEGIDA